MLLKLTPVVNFINVLRVHFLYKILAPKTSFPTKITYDINRLIGT